MFRSLRRRAPFAATSLSAAVLVAALSPSSHLQAQWWKQGQPREMADSPLTPHTAPRVARPGAEIPLARLTLPPGFTADLWAEGMPNARSLAIGARGTVFVGTRFAGNVYAVRDRGGRRVVTTIATGLTQPNGVAFLDGALFVAERSRIVRFDAIEMRLDAPPAPVVVLDGLPTDEPHAWKYLAAGPDRKLYFAIGAPCNACESPEHYARIVRFDPFARAAAPRADAGITAAAATPLAAFHHAPLGVDALETVAAGVRNTLGFAWHPDTRELYFTENGRDWMGDEGPADELNHAPRAGLHFGFPYCYENSSIDATFAGRRPCAAFTPPIATLGPHVAALGLRFYTGSQFPAAYRGRLFVALHGSWNRTRKTGFEIRQVTLRDGQPPTSDTFVGGFLEGDAFWGRPADLLVLPDGSLLISDDWNGALYLIRYRG